MAALRARIAQDYYTPGQAQEQLGVSDRTLKRWVDAGVIEQARFEQVPGCFYVRVAVDRLVAARRAASVESEAA